MQHERGSLFWYDCTRSQVRGVLTRNGISVRALEAAIRARNTDEHTDLRGYSMYLIDTSTNKAARLDFFPADKYAVKVSSRTGTEVLEDVAGTFPALLDFLVFMV